MSEIYENRIAFREFDERCLEWMVEADVDVGFVCGACKRRNCVEMQKSKAPSSKPSSASG